MNVYETQYIEIKNFRESLEGFLNEYQGSHPGARLVAVMPLHRERGERDKYRAVWVKESIFVDPA